MYSLPTLLPWVLAVLLATHVLSFPLPPPDVGWQGSTALARRKTGSGSTKQPFGICGNPQITIAGFSYSASSVLMKDPTCKVVYGPQQAKRLDDFAFGKRPKDASVDKLGYESEHILEFQILKQFFDKLSKSSKNQLYKNPLDPSQLSNAKSRSHLLASIKEDKNNMIGFCDYLRVWWGNHKDNQQFDIGGGQKDYPFSSITQSLPTQLQHGNELVLLEKITNGLKNSIFSANLNIRTPTKMKKWIDLGAKQGATQANIKEALKAFVAIKYAMHVWDYMILGDIQLILEAQADRVVTRFNQIEDEFSSAKTGAVSKERKWLTRPYERLELGKQSETFIKDHMRMSYEKTIKFIKLWAPILVASWTNSATIELQFDGPLSADPKKQWLLVKGDNSLNNLQNLFGSDELSEIYDEDEDMPDGYSNVFGNVEQWDSTDDSAGQGSSSDGSSSDEGGGTGGTGDGTPKTPPGRGGAAGKVPPAPKGKDRTAPNHLPPKADHEPSPTKPGPGGKGAASGSSAVPETRKSERNKDKKKTQADGDRGKKKTTNNGFDTISLESLAFQLRDQLDPTKSTNWFEKTQKKWEQGRYYGGGGGGGGGSGGSGGGGGSQMTLPLRPGPHQQAPPSGAGTTSQSQPGGSGSGSGSGTTSGQTVPAPAPAPATATGQAAAGQSGTQPGGQTTTSRYNLRPKKDGKTQAGSGSGSQQGGSSSTTKGGKQGSGSGKKGGSS